MPAPTLADVERALLGEHAARRLPPDEPGGEPGLALACAPDAMGRPRELVLRFLPRSGGVEVLQLGVALGFPLAPEHLASTARFLHALNLQLPLGSFLLDEEDERIAYHASVPLLSERIEPDLVRESVAMVCDLVTALDPLVELVAAHGLPHARAMEALVELFASGDARDAA